MADALFEETIPEGRKILHVTNGYAVLAKGPQADMGAFAVCLQNAFALLLVQNAAMGPPCIALAVFEASQTGIDQDAKALFAKVSGKITRSFVLAKDVGGGCRFPSSLYELTHEMNAGRHPFTPFCIEEGDWVGVSLDTGKLLSSRLVASSPCVSLPEGAGLLRDGIVNEIVCVRPDAFGLKTVDKSSCHA